jgi:dienelactone hydrolase
MNYPELPASTKPLTGSEDLSQRMISGLYRFFTRQTAQAIQLRPARWNRDLSSAEAYRCSIQENRARLARMIGLADPRLPPRMERFSGLDAPGLVAETVQYAIQEVRWNVLDGLDGEGLLLTPANPVSGLVIAIPDADQTPEQLVGLAAGIEPESQFARRLAESGFQVLVPALINRDCSFSKSAAFGQTNQTHREWIYRQAYEMGRHIIGVEIQKIQAAIDWFNEQSPGLPVGAAGYGEGGLLAFYAGAVDERIRATLVSGYFKSRQDLWQEPVYRNLWGLLAEFGDAEIASLVAPRSLAVEYSPEPEIDYSPPLDIPVKPGQVAAPGKCSTPAFEQVQAEFERIATLVGPALQPRRLFCALAGAPLPFGSEPAITWFARELGASKPSARSDADLPRDLRPAFAPNARQKRLVSQMERFLQELVRDSEEIRTQFFLGSAPPSSLEQFIQDSKPLRRAYWEDLIGRLEAPLPDCNPRARLVYEQEKWIGYEILLDVWEDVFAWGILCIPRGLRPGEARPVVVCQHGLEGRPLDTIEDTPDGLQYYHQFAARLAERGFVTFAPHNPYRGEGRYRQLQRLANPLKATLGSVIVAQHTQILRWLSSLSFVDPSRIAFYGLSYGGWTAMRIPQIVEQYCLSICSANFNDWIRKVTSLRFSGSYMGDASFEMGEWNAGSTFSHAEAAYLMIPRPFMVERGMHDPVAPDAWVASEYARVRWLYTRLGIGQATEIEFFNGQHEINGQAAFEFLHHHLHWPSPKYLTETATA